MDSVGGQEPEFRRVVLYAFRGDRRPEFLAEFKRRLEDSTASQQPSLMDCLLYSGHVGVSLEGDSAIYGFSPAFAEDNIDQQFEDLKAGEVFAGVVRDDQDVFSHANAIGLDVVCIEYLYQPEEFARLRQRCREELNKSQFTYGFPGGTGDCNCATWPAKLGFKIPEATGLMKAYIAAMLAIESPIRVG